MAWQKIIFWQKVPDYPIRIPSYLISRVWWDSRMVDSRRNCRRLSWKILNHWQNVQVHFSRQLIWIRLRRICARNIIMRIAQKQICARKQSAMRCIRRYMRTIANTLRFTMMLQDWKVTYTSMALERVRRLTWRLAKERNFWSNIWKQASRTRTDTVHWCSR